MAVDSCRPDWWTTLSVPPAGLVFIWHALSTAVGGTGVTARVACRGRGEHGERTHSVVVNFPSAGLRRQPRSASRFSFERIAFERAGGSRRHRLLFPVHLLDTEFLQFIAYFLKLPAQLLR